MPYTNHPSTAPSSIHITSRDNYIETSLRLINIHAYTYIQLSGGGRAMQVRRILLEGATCVITVAVAPCKLYLVPSLMYLNIEINDAQQYLHSTVLTPNGTNAQRYLCLIVTTPSSTYTRQYLQPTVPTPNITTL